MTTRKLLQEKYGIHIKGIGLCDVRIDGCTVMSIPESTAKAYFPLTFTVFRLIGDTNTHKPFMDRGVIILEADLANLKNLANPK